MITKINVFNNKDKRILIENRGKYVVPHFQVIVDKKWRDIACLSGLTIERPDGRMNNLYRDYEICDDIVIFRATTQQDNNVWGVVDKIKSTDYGFELERTWNYKGSYDPNVALLVELVHPDLDVDFWMIPGLIYNGNPIKGSGYHQTGNGIGPQPDILYPTGWEWGGVPWTFSEEIPVPSATWLRKGEIASALFCQPQSSSHDLLSATALIRDEKNNEIRNTIYIPSRDVPMLYRDKNGFTPGRYNWLSVSNEWSYQRKFYITLYNEEAPFAMAGFNRAAWDAMKAYRNIPRFSIDEIQDLRREYLLKYHLIEQEDVCGIVQGLYNDGTIRENWMSDGFLALNVEFAYYLYSNSIRTKNEHQKNIALKMINFYLSEQFENGLFYSNYDLNTNQWGYQFGDNCCFTRPMGERLCNLLDIVDIVQENHIRNKILAFCRKSADFFINNQCYNGSFGKIWSNDGQLIEDTGSNFSYITWFLSRFYQIEQDEKYLIAAERSFAHIQKLIDQEDVKHWVDCLDSGAIDREGATAYLQALNILYDVTENDIYIKYARTAAEMALTWQYTYDIHFDLETPMGGTLLGGNGEPDPVYTSGLTLVSVEHPCADAWGARLGYELLRLSRFCGDQYYYERGLAAIASSQQVIARKPGNYGLSLVGSQPEQMKTRDWCYGFIGQGKGSCHVLIAWNQVLNLGVLERLRRDFSKEIARGEFTNG